MSRSRLPTLPPRAAFREAVAGARDAFAGDVCTAGGLTSVSRRDESDGSGRCVGVKRRGAVAIRGAVVGAVLAAVCGAVVVCGAAVGPGAVVGDATGLPDGFTPRAGIGFRSIGREAVSRERRLSTEEYARSSDTGRTPLLLIDRKPEGCRESMRDSETEAPDEERPPPVASSFGSVPRFRG